jgi:pimeloyl-ACP methyl ester carboxylesterase
VTTPATTRYARSGDLSIAYQVTGGGPIDLVLVPGFISHLEMDWQEPRSAHFLARLGSFARLIRFDKRGTGLSDRPGEMPDLEARMDDVRAVLDAVDSEKAVLFGYSEGGPMCCLFAATYPQRTSALVLYGTYAKRRDPDDDYPWAPTREEREVYADELASTWAWKADLQRVAPSADAALAEWWATRARAAASPGAARALILMNSAIDVRAVLPSIRVPTLVLHRSGDRDASVDEGRYLAERIPDARFVELPGRDHVPWIDGDQIVDEVEEFLTGVRGRDRVQRRLATIMFIDIVASTDLVVRLGDAEWRALLERHNASVRRILPRYDGREVSTAGDGLLAVFDGPARAIRCGCELVDSAGGLGLQLRVGIHTGECEMIGDDVAGIAVHIAARVASKAEPSEVLVSRTLRDIVAGSGLEFGDGRTRVLKGVPGEWQLFAVLRSG